MEVCSNYLSAVQSFQVRFKMKQERWSVRCCQLLGYLPYLPLPLDDVLTEISGSHEITPKYWKT